MYFLQTVERQHGGYPNKEMFNIINFNDFSEVTEQREQNN